MPQTRSKLSIQHLLRSRRWSEQRDGSTFSRNLAALSALSLMPLCNRPTRLSARLTKLSKLVAACFATAFTNKGSNLAESSSFATVRAILIPSVWPGGPRAPFTNACDIASFRREDERERYNDSNTVKARRTTTVSGLTKRHFLRINGAMKTL